MTDIWASSGYATLFSTDDLKDSVEDPTVVDEGDVAVAFDTGSEDLQLVYASSWTELASDLERVAARIRRTHPEEG